MLLLTKRCDICYENLYFTNVDLSEAVKFGGILCCRFSTERASEKKLKIGQYLPKIWTKVCGLVFWATLYMSASLITLQNALE